MTKRQRTTEKLFSKAFEILSECPAPSKNGPKLVGTHDGTFHCDEALGCADTYVPEPPHCTCGPRAPGSCVPYMPEAQGSWCATLRTPYAYQPLPCRTSLCRTRTSLCRTAYLRTTGARLRDAAGASSRRAVATRSAIRCVRSRSVSALVCTGSSRRSRPSLVCVYRLPTTDYPLPTADH